MGICLKRKRFCSDVWRPSGRRLAAEALARQGRQHAKEILEEVDDRVMVIVGPCSIHDVKAGCVRVRERVRVELCRLGKNGVGVCLHTVVCPQLTELFLHLLPAREPQGMPRPPLPRQSSKFAATPQEGVCRPAEGTGGGAVGGRAGHHAGVLREAAHHRGVEGPHQRPRPRQLLPHQQGCPTLPLLPGVSIGP